MRPYETTPETTPETIRRPRPEGMRPRDHRWGVSVRERTPVLKTYRVRAREAAGRARWGGRRSRGG